MTRLADLRVQTLIVRCKIDEHHFSIPAQIPQADASQAAPGNWREQFKRVLRCLSAPASFDLFGHLARGFKPRLQPSEQTGSGIRQTLKILLWLVGLHADQSDREVRAACAKNQIIRSKKL